MTPRDNARIDRWAKAWNWIAIAATVWGFLYVAYSLAIDEPRPTQPTTYQKPA